MLIANSKAALDSRPFSACALLLSAAKKETAPKYENGMAEA
jgi:hypothetical protein